MKQIPTLQGPFWVLDQDQVGAVLLGQQFWDWQLKPYMDQAARADGWALDLGAAFGWFTVYLAHRYGHVLAVEANPILCDLLRRNVQQLGVAHKVEVANVAAYDREIVMQVAPESWLGWPVPANLNETPNPCSIAFTPVDAADIPARFAPTIQGGPIDQLVPADAPVAFIKVDVQGCDLRALVGLAQTITRCRPLIVFEYESGPLSWHGDHWPDILAFFAGLTYEVSQTEGGNFDYVARPR